MQQQPSDTFQMIQFGNLDLDYRIDKAILLLGQTKAGKTTASHHLARQVLEGIKNSSQNVVYHVKGGEKKFKNAQIGNNEHTSETQIPNVFKTKLKEDFTIHIIDCPGYLDTFGCSRMISNAYFHFKVFRQVEKVKLVLTIQLDDMNGKATNFYNTFKAFYNGFTSFMSDKSFILDASALLITKVPKNVSIDDIVKKLSTIDHFRGKDLKAAFESFKNEVISKNKIFVFHSAELGKKNNYENHLLEEINAKTKFWWHDLNRIKISIKDKVLKRCQDNEDDEFKQELQRIGNYYQLALLGKFNRLQNIMQQLLKQSYEINDTSLNNYLLLIQNYINEEIRPHEKSNSMYMNYQDKRKENRVKLKEEFISNTESVSTNHEKPLWLQKITIVEDVYWRNDKIMKRNASNQEYLYSLEGLQEYSKIVLNFIQQIIRINNPTAVSPLMKFAYDIKSIIQTSNTFYQILKDQKKGIELDNPLAFMLIEYPTKLVSILNIFDETPLHKRIKLARKLDITNQQVYSQPSQYYEIMSFLIDVRHQIDVKRQLKPGLSQELDRYSTDEIDSILKEVASVQISLGLLNYHLKLSTINQKNAIDMLQIIKQIEAIRNRIQTIFAKNQVTDAGHTKNISSMKMKIQRMKCINLLASALIMIPNKEEEDLALQLYDFTCNAYKIFEHYSKKDEFMKKSNVQGHKRTLFLIKYSMTASRYRRFDLAFKKLQEASYLATNGSNEEDFKHLQQVSQTIMIESANLPSKCLCFDGNSSQQFPDELFHKIKKCLKDTS